MRNYWNKLKIVPIFGLAGWGFLLWVLIPVLRQHRDRGFGSTSGDLIILGVPICGLALSFAARYLWHIEKYSWAILGTAVNVVAWGFCMWSLMAAAAI